jgi:hypothetical protein
MDHSVTNGSIFALFTIDTYLIRRATMKKLVPKKTRKAIRKNLRKIIKKHGPELALWLADRDAPDSGEVVPDVHVGTTIERVNRLGLFTAHE